IENARDGLNRAYKVRETRSWFLRRLQGIIFVVLVAFSIIAVAFVLVGTPFLWRYLVTAVPVLAEFSVSVSLTRYGISIAVLGLALYAFHYFLPAGRRNFHSLIFGIIFTILGILIGSELFAFYLRTIANYTALYAGLAGLMIAIVYLYGVSIMILFGAEVNNALGEYRASLERDAIEDGPGSDQM
ncbi:MAG: YhjD/YihY/BrkB family envelope integrity protein, partial [Pseudomonadota bacterium]